MRLYGKNGKAQLRNDYLAYLIDAGVDLLGKPVSKICHVIVPGQNLTYQTFALPFSFAQGSSKPSALTNSIRTPYFEYCPPVQTMRRRYQLSDMT